MGLILGNYLMQEGLVNQVLRQRPARLGLGFVRGKLNLFTTGPFYVQWLVQAYALFGDPAMKLPLSEGGLYLPAVQVRQSSTLRLPMLPVGATE